ncbi:MAG: sigma-70 family RNA polymerase sigma factor [Balneolaceae bacterium]|nr:MAG: sigma-70 family RNA polymerase sigma factor [Balneolaceae bacterium]
MSDSPKTVTILLKEAGKGDTDSVNNLFDIVYNELQQMAHFYLRELSNSDTINTTALVHEAYLKLFDKEKLTLENRVHFFALCGKVMRQILVDYYRKKTAKKRGGEAFNKTLSEELLPGTEHCLELLDLDLALCKLEKLNSRLSVVVECKFFAAMNDDEIALYLGVTDRTVRNDWRKARMWLSRELSGL